MAENNSERITKLRELWSEHGWPILIYFIVSLGVTWPIAAHFTTRIPGDSYDAYNGLWVMWHTKEALLGHQPFFNLPLLYYPNGATLLTHVPGLATGLFALPFWFLGPEAAHNGAVLISFVLTGYFTYLLGRTVGLNKPVAFFAGLVLLVAPMHLVGLWGHTTKVFLGAAPLVLLCLFRIFDLNRTKQNSALWAVATALSLLFAMLHDSFQFLTAVMAVLLVTLYFILTAKSADRLRLFQRFLVVIAASLFFVGPLFLMTARAAYDPSIVFDLNYISFDYQPDVIEFVLPPTHSRLFGSVSNLIFQRFNILPSIETAVSISLVTIPLLLLVAFRGQKKARFWLLFSLFWIILSLGPAIRIFNHTQFTEYNLPIIMPYAFLTGLPGLDFLRTPGRFMQIGFVGLAISAGWGLTLLCQRWPRRASAITAAAILFLLFESWPQPWRDFPLRPIPEFYQQLAGDEDMYGILDLPVTALENIPAIMYDANYQIYQMTHGKGIPMGYISRTYRNHPLFPCLYDLPIGDLDLRVNDQPAPCPFQPRFDLPLNNYRYIVVHKPQPNNIDYKPGAFGESEAAEFIAQYLNNETPIANDALVTVYEMPAVPDISALETTIGFGENWYAREMLDDDVWHWAQSPSQLIITSPHTQTVELEIIFFRIYIPENAGSDYQSLLHFTLDNGPKMTLPIQTETSITIPLELSPGKHSLTLELEAGNFAPAELGAADNRLLSFAVRYINLRTTTP